MSQNGIGVTLALAIQQARRGDVKRLRRQGKDEREAKRRKAPSKPLIGWREWVHLPDLGGCHVKAKVDTGARTSAIHAWNIAVSKVRGLEVVTFDLHPIQGDDRTIVPCRATLLGMRAIRNSGGQTENRYVIETTAEIGTERWRIQLSLTQRDEMGFRMLLGRSALKGRFLVNPGRSFLLGPPR